MIGPGPLAEWNADTSELTKALSKRRSTVESRATTFESEPAPSNADASHLDGISFTGPAVQEWLQSIPGAPEEDRVSELLAKAVAERGELPAHVRGSDTVHFAKLSESLEELRKCLEDERRQLGAENEQLQQRQAEIEAQERSLAAERQQQERIAETLRNYPRPPWLEKIEATINIGIVGNSGVGKSLLINALRGLHAGAEGWAPVGIQETTRLVSMYAFPNEQRVRLLDFPGAGTPEFPLKTYIARMGLRYLDQVIIVTAGRFTETELALRTELEEHGVPYAMVRTKIDIDVWNNAQDNNFSPEETVIQIIDDMKMHGVTRPYLVSLREPKCYDFPALMSDIFPCLRETTSLGEGWDDAWALPQVYSKAVALLQGRWCDSHGTYYFVQGLEVHVQKQQGDSYVNGLVTLSEESGKIWWQTRWWIDLDSVASARVRGDLRWANKWTSSALQPMVWRWAD